MPTPHNRFVAPARAYSQLWRLALGVVLMVILFFAGVAGLLWLIWTVRRPAGDGFLWAEQMIAAETPEGVLVLLATFVAMALAAFIVARLLHKRGPGTLFGPGVTVLRDFVRSAGIVFVMLLLSLVLWSWTYDAVPNVPVGTWIALLPLALLGVLIQTGAEELVFRGYLQQQLAARFATPLAWMVVPSLLFGIIHYDQIAAGDNVWVVVGYAALFGLIAADLTARTGSIGAAWGFHFANNVLAILVLATDGTITGLSLWLTPYNVDDIDAASGWVLLDLGFLILVWWLVRRVVSR